MAFTDIYYLIIGLIIFLFGLIGFFTKKNVFKMPEKFNKIYSILLMIVGFVVMVLVLAGSLQ